MEPNNRQLALCWVGDQMPGLVAPSLEREWSAGSRDVFDAFMVRASLVPDVAHLGYLTPTHRGKLRMQVYNELSDLWRQGFTSFSCSALLRRCEQALHPVLFKLICFAGQRAPGDIDFFGSLPCGFVEQDEGSDRLIQLLL